MSPDFAIWICRQTLYTALLLAAPMLIAGLVVGLTISIFQAATQVNEMTLTFIPKILAVVIVLLLLMPWMINIMTRFTHELFAIVAGGML
ncbi:MAG: flagellar biosynthesis protein FliQ [Calditrichota bacterium]